MADALKLTREPDETIREGWQLEAAYTQRKFHFIRDTTSLCRKFGFYFGPLVDGLKNSNSVDDCAECKRRVDKELAKIDATPSSGDPA